VKGKVWELLKKVKKNWSCELKCATTTTKTKVTKVRAKLEIISTRDINASTMKPLWCQLSSKLSVLFKLHAITRRLRSHFLYNGQCIME